MARDTDPGRVTIRRPSALWTALAVVVGMGAIASMVGALALVREAQRPIGEGELFRAEARRVADVLSRTDTITEDDLRHIRNDLTIEAVSLIRPDGVVEASTSAPGVGSALENPILAGFAERARFGAAAVPLHEPVELDGMQEWSAGDVVYEVVQPLPDGRAVLLTYDISELLARRSATRETPTGATELLVLAAVLVLAAAGLSVARARVVRTYREFQLESEYLRRESRALAAHNRELDEARRSAERAFELAEEKNRIRSEFVLMINHELRTPLTGVVTGGELLRSEGAIDDPTWRAVLDDVIRDGIRLREMIDQILAVARIENRALFFELEDVLLGEVVGRLRRANPRIGTPIDGRYEELRLRTDTTSLVSLINALAANATTHGAGRVELSVRHTLPFDPMLEVGSRPDPAAFFVVEDDGPGIDSAFLPRAFEKFEKDSRSSGTGLGLYVARKMAEALDASILVSTSPEGTTFAVAVPVASDAEAAA